MDGNNQITDEKMWEKQSLKNMTKKEMFRFSDHQIIEERNENEAFLPDDVSIMIAYHKKYAEKIEIKNMMSFTNMNVLRSNRKHSSFRYFFFGSYS